MLFLDTNIRSSPKTYFQSGEYRGMTVTTEMNISSVIEAPPIGLKMFVKLDRLDSEFRTRALQSAQQSARMDVFFNENSGQTGKRYQYTTSHTSVRKCRGTKQLLSMRLRQ
ncbi:hypothetical protein PUN28_001839 [Cardiocondyla obscurior]|uniref:Uncharacterized protein n=1 Tax=Cardiocondyla obscurior TaxID=286306 RepID=A0AAW2GRH8_9HYME